MICTGGMVEYHSDSDTVATRIPYPSIDKSPFWYEIQFCKHNEDSIVLTQAQLGRGIEFNTKTHQFGEMFPLGQRFM